MKHHPKKESLETKTFDWLNANSSYWGELSDGCMFTTNGSQLLSSRISRLIDLMLLSYRIILRTDDLNKFFWVYVSEF